MKGTVYIDGKYYLAAEAKISVYDHGFLYGDGLFETMRTFQGKIFKLKEHLDRLYYSAEQLQIEVPLNEAQMEDALFKTLKKNNLFGEAYIRLTVTRGSGPIGIDPVLCPRASVIIMVKDLVTNPELYRKGISVVILETKRNDISSTDPRLKSMNFLNNIIAKMEVKSKGAAEGIMLNNRGEIAEATVSNVFLIKDGVLKTPFVEAGILPGITRQVVMDISPCKCYEGPLYPADLFSADEIFLTNSGSGIIPVTMLDCNRVGNGKVGFITNQLNIKYESITCL